MYKSQAEIWGTQKKKKKNCLIPPPSPHFTFLQPLCQAQGGVGGGAPEIAVVFNSMIPPPSPFHPPFFSHFAKHREGWGEGHLKSQLFSTQ